MHETPPAPEHLAASTFRASIDGRNVAVDFGHQHPARADGTVDIDIARRIVVDRATAYRLISALQTCLREHETRWRILPPGMQAAPKAPTPSHAQPDAAAPQAALLFRLMDETRAPHMYERSVRFTESTMAANRFLLSLSRQQAKDAFESTALRLAERIGLPAAFRDQASQQIGNARAVHLGFEGDERILFKYYIEFDPAAQEASKQDDGSVILHLAFKWDTSDPAHAVISRYHLYPSLTDAQIAARLDQLYVGGNPDSLQIAKGALDVACSRVDADSLQYLEVREDGNDRRSFDLNFYDAGLLVKDLQAPLAQMRQHFSIKPGQFQALYDQIKPQAVGHLAGGVHRNGCDFFNVYYGVQRRQG